jgi:hypothetical protein
MHNQVLLSSLHLESQSLLSTQSDHTVHCPARSIALRSVGATLPATQRGGGTPSEQLSALREQVLHSSFSSRESQFSTTVLFFFLLIQITKSIVLRSVEAKVPAPDRGGVKSCAALSPHSDRKIHRTSPC